jgi:parallel beta-helix repeat protein
VSVTGGEANFRRCRFTGAVGTEGVGLVFAGNATGVVQECEGVDNYHGIAVAGGARPRLENNVYRHNGSGIVYWGDAGGMAIRNDCSENDFVGIGIMRNAQPTLERNVCADNGLAGIWYMGGPEGGDPGGVARGNECAGSEAGIFVQQAHPTLEQNVCTGNLHGINYAENGGGVARQSECAHNEMAGIHVAEAADPDLELVDNNCHDNGEADMDDRRP